MTRTTRTIGTALAAGALVIAGATAPATAARVSLVDTAAQATVTLDYEMNEGAGATVMHDSGSAHQDGSIGNEVKTGTSVDGAVGYQFPRLTPNKPPAHPQHLVQVPDSSALDRQSGSYTIEIRYQTTNKFGNLIQKGQSTAKGGQIKIQLPGGHPSCYYKGSNGRVGAGSRTPINDGRYHTLKCVLDGSGVTFYVDGVRRGHKGGDPGVINNDAPLTIGGKPFCDQIKVTCDYFGGVVDYVRITKS